MVAGGMVLVVDSPYSGMFHRPLRAPPKACPTDVASRSLAGQPANFRLRGRPHPFRTGNGDLCAQRSTSEDGPAVGAPRMPSDY